MHPSPRRVACAALATLAVAAPGAAAQTNAITSVAGSAPGYSGDGGPATGAQLNLPIAVTLLSDGGYLIADQSNNAVRRVAPNGTVTTVAGNGTAGFSGDGGPATSAQMSAPSAAVLTPDGSILIADSNNNRIRRVAPNGTISTAVGTGQAAFGGDGGPATSANIRFPADIAVTPNGDYLIADVDNHRIRFVSGLTGSISTLAGVGSQGFSGDGGPATSAQLSKPSSVALTGDGGFLIADQFNHRIRRVAPDGTITTDAGNAEGYSGDGGPASAAQLNNPLRVSTAFDGGYLIADSDNNRIRRVTRDGIIETAAGTGTAGFSGDGGPAPAAELNRPFGVSVNPDGDYLIADTFNHRIRFVDAGGTEPLPPPPGPSPLAPPEIGETANALPQRGTVRVKLPPGTSAERAKAVGLAGATRSFVKLTEARQVPIGSTFDTRRGTVMLVTAASLSGAETQNGNFSGAYFVAKQPRSNPLTTLQLKGGRLRGCTTRKSTGGAAGSRRRRSLFSNARGRFRTRGRNSTATVRGTAWRTTDTCRGTLTTVTRGIVVVRDLTKRRNRVVRAGGRYLAKPPRLGPRRRR